MTKNAEVIKECQEGEKRTTNMLIINSCFQVLLRIPEIVALVYYLIFNLEMPAFCIYDYQCDIIADLFEFLFALSGVFQFILFYCFNKKFKESYKDAFNINKIGF